MARIDPPKKRWKTAKRLLLAAILFLFAAVGSLPWLASMTPGRLWLLSIANGAVAPARIEAKAIRLSWLGAQEATGLVFRDKGGKALVSVPRALVRRGLLGLLVEQPARADVVLERAVVDLERRADGSYDLLDALAPLTADSKVPPEVADPAKLAAQARAQAGPSVSLRVVNGSITIRSPELARPLTARRLDMTANVPSGTGPVTWRIALADPSEGDDGTLQVTGQLERGRPAAARSDLGVKLVAKGWPLSVTTGTMTATGRVDGDLDMARIPGGWDYSGKTSVRGLDASGPALAGDRLQLDRLDTVYALGASDRGWTLRALNVDSAVATLKAAPVPGAHSPSPPLRVEGRLDLAELARKLPHLLRIREGLSVEKGLANVVVEVGETADRSGSTIVVDARVSDLLARDQARTIAIRDPATLSARVARRADDLQVERLAVKTAFLDASGTGDLQQGIKIAATIDLAGLERQLHDLVDFGGLQLAGHGRLAADYRRDGAGRYLGRLSAEVQKLRVAGLTEQPIARDAVRLDAVAAGPLGESGLPAAWSRTRLAVKADDLSADTSLSTGSPEGPFQIDDLRLALRGPAPVAGSSGQAEPIRFASKGRFDPRSGTLELHPIPGSAKPEPVALAGEGLTVAGVNRGAAMKVSGSVVGDLARLDRAWAWWTAAAPMDLAGAFSAKVGITIEPEGALTAAVALSSPDMTLAPSAGTARRPFGPAAAAFHARRPANLDRVDLENVALACRYASVHASGRVQEPGGKRLADLAGTIAPNWITIDPLVAEWVEPRARIRATPRPFRLRGPLQGGGVVALLQGLEAELGVDRFEAVAFGARVAPTPIVVHWKGRQGLVEPVATTINNGATKLLPSFVIDDRGCLSFRLASGSTIHGAEINDEVSRSLLAFVAPMLHDATQVRGKVTVDVNRAEFPLMGDDSRRSSLIGRVEFDDVVFSAGPLANDLVALSGNRREAALRLNQPVELAIADGRVNQRGLSVPLGRDARLELEGSVGFDRTIAMRARVPINRALLGNRPDAEQLVEGLRVGVPIGGTLAHPTIDRSALGAGLRDAGRTVLKREAADLLKRLATPDRDDRPPARRGR